MRFSDPIQKLMHPMNEVVKFLDKDLSAKYALMGLPKQREDALPRFLAEPPSTGYSLGPSSPHMRKFDLVRTSDGSHSSIYHCFNLIVPGSPQGVECILKVYNTANFDDFFREVSQWFTLRDRLRLCTDPFVHENLRFPALYGAGFCETKVGAGGRKVHRPAILLQYMGTPLSDITKKWWESPAGVDWPNPSDKDSLFVSTQHTREAMQCAGPLLRLYAALHRLGFGHGDTKPGNITLLEGRACLIDLGTVHRLGEPRSHPVCTPTYCPPEDFLHPIPTHLARPKVTAEANLDIYGVGAILRDLFSPFLPLHVSRESAGRHRFPIAAFYEAGPHLEHISDDTTDTEAAGIAFRNTLRTTGIPDYNTWAPPRVNDAVRTAYRNPDTSYRPGDVVDAQGPEVCRVMNLCHATQGGQQVPDSARWAGLWPRDSARGPHSVPNFWDRSRPSFPLFGPGTACTRWNPSTQRGTLRPDTPDFVVDIIQACMHPLWEPVPKSLSWLDPRRKQDPKLPTRRASSMQEVLDHFERHQQEWQQRISYFPL